MGLPGLMVEVALAYGPNEVVPDGNAWTDLSDRVRSFSMKRGRDDRTAQFEPGTVSIVLDNADDELDPLVVGSLVDLDADLGLPLCPIRVTNDYGGGANPLFYGYIGPECWVVQRRRVDGGSTVRLDAFDRVGLFAQLGLPSSLFAAQVQWLRPDWWVRGIGGDVWAGNGYELRDSSGHGVAGEISASGSGVLFEVPSLVEGDSDSAMTTQPGVAGFTDDLSSARANLTMGCVWRGTPYGGDQEILRQRDTGSNVVRWRVKCNSSGEIEFRAYNTGGTLVANVTAPTNTDPASSGRWDDDIPHIIFARIEGGTRMRIWVDGRRDETTSGVPATVNGRVIFGGGAQVASIDEVVYWTRAVPTLDLNSITDAFVGTAPFSGDDFSDRLQRWWDLTDHAAGSLLVRTAAVVPYPMHGVNDMPGSLADAFSATVESFRGTWWAARDGGIVARDYGAPASPDWDDDLAVPVINLTDEPSPAGSPPPVRRSRPEFFGIRLDRIINVSRVIWQGLVFSLRNDASIARFGERVREWTCERSNMLDAAISADDEVNGTGNYAFPGFEVNPVTIDPLVDANAAQFAFVDCELEKAVTLTWTQADDTVASATLNVQAESWEWSGSDCKVTLTLAGISAPETVRTAVLGRFGYTGATEEWTVPDGVTAVTVTVLGAAGGANTLNGVPGNGAKVVTTLPATPGDVWEVNVGGRGTDATAGLGTGVPAAGGWNGGGDGGPTNIYPEHTAGAGGGGASDIRVGGSTLSDRVVVAGGGGGVGGNWNTTFGADGGDGGTVGADGADVYDISDPVTGGEGGTGSAGGAAGYSSAGGAPTAGTLGDGGDGASGTYQGCGGGGGGGYYGGGGGARSNAAVSAGSGGGGGSSYSSGTSTTVTDGDNDSDGEITIRMELP